jgi:son of sevenless-like protein
MMTWKSFTTIDTLVEGLMGRFRLEPPPEIKSTELEEWTQKKLYVVRTRYVYTRYFIKNCRLIVILES